jgi:hypothetical protein
MANDYQPTAIGMGPLTGGGGPLVTRTPDGVIGIGGEGPPRNGGVVPLRIVRGTAADTNTATCRIPFDCEIVAIEANATSGTTPTVTLSSAGSPGFSSTARAMDGSFYTNLITGEKALLKAGQLLTATFNNGGGNTVDAVVVVWVQVIGVSPNP